MYQEILQKLFCPFCHGDLKLNNAQIDAGEIISGELICSCGRKYRILDGIADFGFHEQENLNSWSDFYEQESYKELDKKLNSNLSDLQKQIQKRFLQSITDITSTLSEGILLDIASGRGLLLQELLKTGSPNVQLLSADLSFQVLRWDRIKFKKQFPEAKISYIACDAAHLPIKNETADMVCTFAGFLNMGLLADCGIREAERVLLPGGRLVNSCVCINEKSEGFQKVREILRTNGAEGTEKIFLKETFPELHRKYFDNAEELVVYEGIAEENQDDLIPWPGEWFADVRILSQKQGGPYAVR